MNVAIIGGGVAGLTAAYRLLQKGDAVTIFEKEKQLGGLLRCVEIEEILIERFYHHIFTSDEAFLQLAEELGLDDKICWLESKMGIFTNGKLYPFGTPFNLLRFKPLSLINRFRFGLSTLHLKRQKNLNKLEKITAEEWFLRHAGKQVFETIWKPLLVQKFGNCYNEISIAWIWRKIQMRGDSRSKGGFKEKLGYMEGSFKLFIESLEKEITNLGGLFYKEVEIDKIVSDGNALTIYQAERQWTFDRIITTFAPQILLRLVHQFPDFYVRKLQKIRYTSVVCTILALKQPFSDMYWINIGDSSIPFSGLIEHSNFYPVNHYGGKHILYISHYLFRDNSFDRKSNGELLDIYLPHLKKVNTDFQPDWIEDVIVSRADFAQPVITTNYSQSLPDFETPIKGLYTISMAQVYPEDRGINYAIQLANRLCECLM